MKVVHLIASNGLYGAEKWILALMRAMQASTVKSILVNLSDIKKSTSAVVSTAKEKGLCALDFYTRGSFNPLSAIRLARWLSKEQVKIVHGHGYKPDLIGLIASRLSGCKIISTPHGWTKNPDKKLKIYEKLDIFSFRFMDHVCPLSDELLQSIRGNTHPHKTSLILNAVDVDEILESKPAFKKAPHEFIIGYIGRLIADKDLPTLFHAVKLLCNTFTNDKSIKIRMIIIGDGIEYDNLRKLAQDLQLTDCVDFLGFRKDAVAYLKCFDIFVLPSLSEGVPRCLMEAMAARIPVAASDISGNRILVKHDQTGWLFPAKDNQALYLILKKTFENTGHAVNVTEAANKLIMEKFSNGRMASDYQTLYFQVCHGR